MEKFSRPFPLNRITDPAVIQRFMRFVEKTDNHWIWTGAIDCHGYGKFWFAGHTVCAHRVSYAIFRGPVPLDKVVHHIPDNHDHTVKHDVNPANLELTTLEENGADGQRRQHHHRSRSKSRSSEVPF